MQVDPTYLDEAFAEFDLKKGSTTFPDLRPILEQEGSQPLSAEGHARFRRVLGRLSWYCQTRQDLLILVSMLGTGQAQPFETHEKCLRAVLRYLMTDMDVALRFPSEELALPDVKGLEVYTDAGFAPMKSTGRRSVSGTCFIFQQCLMKCFSRHQSAVTLSSCEAELVALQSGVQEGIGLLRTLGFVLGRLYPWVDIIPQDAQVTWYDEAESDDEDSMKVSYLFPLVVKTDSLSGKMLLEASDLQRKSRHIEIKVYWLRELMDRKVLLLLHVPGTLNPADCFTKCLPTQKFLFYRNMLGFVKVDFSLISNILGFCLKVCDNSYIFKTNFMFVKQELRFVRRTFDFVCFGRRTRSFRRSEIISSCESCVCSRKLDKPGQFASCCRADGRGRHTVQCLRVHSCGLDDRRAKRGPNWGRYAPRCSG